MTHQDQIRTTAAAVAAARDTYRATLADLRADILTADRAGVGRNEIVRCADGGMSRRMVYETLGAADLLSDARAALGKRAVSLWTAKDRVYLDLSPQVTNGWEGPEDGDLTPYEREQRERREKRQLEDSATAALSALREKGMTFAGGDDAIEALTRFEQAEIVRRG